MGTRYQMMAPPPAIDGSRGSIQKSSYTELAVSSGAADQAEKPSATPPVRKSATVEKPFWETEKAAYGGVFCNWLNVLLVFVPVGIYSGFLFKLGHCNSAIVFGTNFIAIVPLASILGAATESLATHTGQLIGGLLNATFGNAVEMIMCIQAVKAGLIRVVQGNLLGSILSNMLLVLGMSIFAAGMIRKEQEFNAQGAAANMTCQVVASISICLPTMFRTIGGSTDAQVLLLSRICSLFLAFVYFMFLFFQLKTHAYLFEDTGNDPRPGNLEGVEEEAEEEEAQLSVGSSVVLLAGTTLIVAACSECLVDSIEDVSENFGLPKAFIGVILLPIVGNAAEHATAVTCAMKGMMDLALGVAVGSSTQIALFVVPCAVLFGWGFDKPMTLGFRNFDTACQMLSVFLVGQVLQHGNTNWLHGAMLMTTYLLVAIITWFIPED